MSSRTENDALVTVYYVLLLFFILTFVCGFGVGSAFGPEMKYSISIEERK